MEVKNNPYNCSICDTEPEGCPGCGTSAYVFGFEAGADEEAKRGFERASMMYDDGGKAGIRKVIGWINNNPVFIQSNSLGIKVPIAADPEWQAFLKELNYEES